MLRSTFDYHSPRPFSPPGTVVDGVCTPMATATMEEVLIDLPRAPGRDGFINIPPFGRKGLALGHTLRTGGARWETALLFGQLYAAL